MSKRLLDTDDDEQSEVVEDGSSALSAGEENDEERATAHGLSSFAAPLRPAIRRRTEDDEVGASGQDSGLGGSEGIPLGQHTAPSSSSRRRVRFSLDSKGEAEALEENAEEQRRQQEEMEMYAYAQGDGDGEDEDNEGPGFYMANDELPYGYQEGGEEEEDEGPRDASQLPGDNDYRPEDEDKRREKESLFLASFNNSASAAAAPVADTLSSRAAILAALGRKVKKPSSSWILYTNHARELLPAALSFKERAQEMARDFRALSADARQLLDAQAEQERSAYVDAIKFQYEGLSPEEQEEGRKLLKAGSAAAAAKAKAAASARAVPMVEHLSKLSVSSKLTLPLARVKKIAKLDGDVKALAKDGAVSLAKAVELFIGFISVKSAQTAALRGAKSIKLSDVQHAIHSDVALSFLKEDFPRSVGGAQGGNGQEQSKNAGKGKSAGRANPPGKAAKAPPPVAEAGKISSFFAQKAPPSNNKPLVA